MADQTAETPAVTAEPPVAGEAPPEARTAALERELAEAQDRLLRLAAEMDNLRRRTEREIADTRAYAVTSFARELLAVVDNLRRALDAVPPAERQAGEGALPAMFQGVEVTERELLRVLAKHDVQVIEADGRKFDPNLHQAMFEVERPDVPAGMVVQVLQTGYRIGERVLRPALVGVSKGGRRPGEATSGVEAARADLDRTA